MAYKKYPNSKQFSKTIAKSISSSYYLFIGEEEGEKDKIIKRMIDIHLSGESDRSNMVGKYYLTDDKNSNEEFMSAVDFALSSSMFSSKKIVIIKNIDRIKTTNESKNLLTELFSEIPDETVIIFTLSKNSIPTALEKIFPETGEIIQFWKYFENDIFSYIQRELKEKGVSLDSESISTIIKLTGNDIKKIDEALEMVFYAGHESKIDAALIGNIIGEVKEITVFDFIDLLFANNKSSIPMLKRLLDEGVNDLLILNMILRQADLIEKYYLLLRNMSNPDEALKKIGVGFSKPRREKFNLFLKKFKEQNIRKIYPLIAKAEYKIKSGLKGKSILSHPVFELTEKILSIK